MSDALIDWRERAGRSVVSACPMKAHRQLRRALGEADVLVIQPDDGEALYVLPARVMRGFVA